MTDYPLPRSLLFEVTQRCNHACLHCYNVWHGEAAGAAHYPRGELGTARMLALLNKALDDTGCRSVTLTGGEPLLRRDLPTLLDLLRSRRVRVTLISNGRLLTDPVVASLIRRGVDLFELPLLSDRRETHDALSGTAGAWDAVLGAMSSIRRHHGHFVAAFVITRLNCSDLYETIRLSFAFGARAIMLNRFNPGGRGRLHLNELLPSVDQVRRALNTAEAAAIELGVPIACAIPIPPCLIDVSSYPHLGFGYCAAGTERAYYTIDPLGNVRPCNHSDMIVGNLLHESFAEVLGNPHLADFVDALPNMCEACTQASTCRGGCKAAAQVCYGTPCEPEPFVRSVKDAQSSASISQSAFLTEH